VQKFFAVIGATVVALVLLLFIIGLVADTSTNEATNTQEGVTQTVPRKPLIITPRCTPAPGADLRDCDFRSANLSGADLSNANLRGANLRGVKLVGAKLINAVIINANLAYADLSDADLTNANVSLSNFSNTYLRRANLSGANFRSTILDTCTDFTNAIIRGTDFTGATKYQTDACR